MTRNVSTVNTLRCVHFVALFLMLILASNACSSRQQSYENAQAPTVVNGARKPDPLTLHAAIEKGISANKVHSYELSLSSSQRVTLSVWKGDLSLQVAVCEPMGNSCEEFTSLRYGPVEVPITAYTAGVYRLEIRSLERDDATRQYRLQVLSVDTPQTQHDQARAAARQFGAAELLQARWEEESFRSAIDKYAEASKLWKSAGDMESAADALRSAGDVYFILSNYSQALNEYKHAFDVSRAARDSRGEANALISIGYVYIYLGNLSEAKRFTEKALAIVAELHNADSDLEYQRAHARILNNLGEISYELGELGTSVVFLERSLTSWSETGGDRYGEALAHLNAGYVFSNQGNSQKAEEHFQTALALSQSANNNRGVALAKNALGLIQSLRDEEQTAIDLHNQALSIFRSLGDRRGEAAAFNSIGTAYEKLGQVHSALDNYERALKLYEHIGERDFAALNKIFVARSYNLLGDQARALDYYNQSIAASREVGNNRVQTYALQATAALYQASGRSDLALRQLQEALRLNRLMGNRRDEARTLSNVCSIYSTDGKKSQALECFRRALALNQGLSDRRAEAETRFNIARLERDSGDFLEALSQIKESINIIENVRTGLTNRGLLESYSASVDQFYELYISLLMQLHKVRPGAHFDTEALLASERGRTQTLLKFLIREKSPLNQRGDPSLFQRERTLQQLIATKSEFQTRLLNSTGNKEELLKVEGEIRALTAEHDEILLSIRQQDPNYALLTQPAALRIEDIQRELTDENTVLIEFRLGEERSFLWLLTATTVTSVELPNRNTIESAVRRIYSLLSAREEHPQGETPEQYQARIVEADYKYRSQALALSQMLLGPIAGQLDDKRLLIVPDGALHYLPFEALPDPALATETLSSLESLPEPLLVKHEVVGLPSATVLVALRRTNKEPAPKTIAVIADPVFGANDPRLGQPIDKGGGDQNVSHDSAGQVRDQLQRLPYTLEEARRIVQMVPAEESMLATGFAANRERVLSGESRNYRILHFATHGLLNNENPEMSGIGLSTVDEYGNPQNDLILRDIYSLDLSTDLVVLSGCRTALGKIERGEGLLSLTRGFMFAGSKSVIASLWAVDDRTTTKLMSRFYSGLLTEGFTPSAALRTAKLEMLKEQETNAPYYWAAFVLQGEYREHFHIGTQPPAFLRPMLQVILLVVATVGVLVLLRFRWRTRSRLH